MEGDTFFETVIRHPLFWVFCVTGLASLLYWICTCIKPRRNKFSNETSATCDEVASNDNNFVFQSQVALISPRSNQEESFQDRKDPIRIAEEGYYVPVNS